MYEPKVYREMTDGQLMIRAGQGDLKAKEIFHKRAENRRNSQEITMTETLYILMRNDLDSLNSGKACAQAAHAANVFQSELEGFRESFHKGIFGDHVDLNDAKNLIETYNSWWNQTRGFGTTITLSADHFGLKTTIHNAHRLGFIAGFVNDPTYPVRDGHVTHLVSLVTCGYVFVPDPEAPEAQILKHFPLMR